MAITQIPSEFISTNAISGTIIADNAITAVHIATNAVSGTLIADNAITAVHIATNAVSGTLIADNAVTAVHVAGSSITATQIQDNAVGTGQLAGIARGKIIYGDSSGDPQLLALGSNGQVLKSDGTDIAWGSISTPITALNSATENELVTVGSTTTELNAESGLTWDTSTLTVTGAATVSTTLGVTGVLTASAGVTTAANQRVQSSSGMLFLTGAAAIPFEVGAGSEKMRLTSTGLGIGTASPTSDLHVYNASNPQIRIGTDEGSSIMQMAYTDGSGYFLRMGDAANNEDVMIRTYGDSHFNGGNVGIGTTSPTIVGSYGSVVDVRGTTTDQNYGGAVRLASNNGSTSASTIHDIVSGLEIKKITNAPIKFFTNNLEKMRIEADGTVYICPSTLITPTIVHSGGIGSLSKLRLINRSGQAPDKGGVVELGGVTDDSYTRSDIFGAVAGLKTNATSANREGYMSFYTNTGSALAERLRILSGGDIVTGGKTAVNQTTTGGLDIRPSGTVLRGDFSVANNEFVIWGNYGSPAGTASMQFRYDNSAKGSIGLTSSAVSFNTSSDYRLKENVDYTWNATTRLKQLKPARFNWISDDTNTLIDGFLAHEVSSIVPEAIHGEKDAVYPVGHELEGEIKGQEMDHSKLVPLLVKTIQELEARLTAGGL